jgi:hypothetical protein
MGVKLSRAPLRNPKGKDWVVDLDKGSGASILHNFARFGMLGHRELDLLYPLHDRTLYRTLQLLNATNNDYIKNVDWQVRHRNQMWSTDLFFDLTSKGRTENDKRNVPDFEPPAGSDFDHRAMSVRWAVSLYAGISSDPSRRLIEWPEIKGRLTPKTPPSVQLDDKQVRTDWTPFGIQAGEHYQFSRGPEIDCSTESHPVIKRKLMFHARAAEERLYETQLGMPNDFIPFVTISERRKLSMMDDLAELIKDKTIKPKLASLFGFAVFPYFGSKEPLDTRAYTMRYERVGFPAFYFNGGRQ